MNTPFTVACDVRFERQGKGAAGQMEAGKASCPPAQKPGRVPRVARLLALAIRLEGLVRSGAVANYSQLAKLGAVSRARITQLLNLALLAPDIQEQILFLPRITSGRDPIRLAQLQPIALELAWERQRGLWDRLVARHRMCKEHDVLAGSCAVGATRTSTRRPR